MTSHIKYLESYCAIRHKPTGFFLPSGNRRRYGYSHDEPADPKVFPPRLFTSEGAAKCALTWWLKGETSVRYVGSFEYGDIDEDWHTDQVPERKCEDMEIVTLTVSWVV